MKALTPTQVEVAQLFFSLPESEHFLAAGGAALVAAGLTNRPTGDLDLFTGEPGTVLPAMEALIRAAAHQGWMAQVFRSSETYVRVIITADEPVEIDLALDARPERPPVVTVLGPSLDPVELAGHKLLALFGRALPRDLADVYDLAQRFGTDEIVDTAGAH